MGYQSRILRVGGDDVVVTHTPGNVIQGSEYYPFGVQAATSWTRQSNVANNFLYNGGTELNQTTQVYDLYYRNYDPVLGRFGQVDPMAGKFASLTPYNYGNNNPVFYNDPLGDCPTCGCEVCDAPNLFWGPQRAYEGGSLTPFEQFAQNSLSLSYGSANGSGLSQAGGNYGALRGQVFNERVVSAAKIQADKRSWAYANGIPYNEFGLSRSELLKVWNRMIHYEGEQSFEEWASDHGYDEMEMTNFYADPTQGWPSSHELELRFGVSFIRYLEGLINKYENQSVDYNDLFNEIQGYDFPNNLEDTEGQYQLRLLGGNFAVESPSGSQIFQRFFNGKYPREIPGMDGHVLNPGVGLPTSPFDLPSFPDAWGNKIEFVIFFEIVIPK